jgi:zinc D-Ala-D-Ala carboxypeptidase
MAPMSRVPLALTSLLLVLVAAGCSTTPSPTPSPAGPTPIPTVAPTPDTAAPAVASQDPAVDGLLGSAGITVHFTEPVHGVDGASFQLADAAGTVQAATVSLDPDGLVARLVPAVAPTFASTYIVTLSGLISDRAGNALARSSWKVATSDVVAFGPGIFTGYQFGRSTADLVRVKRWSQDASSAATATEYRVMDGAGYLLVDAGALAGFWVHGSSDGTAQDNQVAPLPPLPICTYVDIPATRVNYADWGTTVLDTVFQLPGGYAPPDLVDTSRAGLNSGYFIRSVALPDLTAMVAAAAADGARLAVQSAYRSYRGQVLTFNGWVSQVGYNQALLTSARPGHSEHQLGTAIDFRAVGGVSPWRYADWATTREGSWLAANAWKYGWVLSYPKGATAVSCYRYEPWHYRYVGRATAAAVHAAGVTLRQWLWSQGDGVR